MKTFKFLLIFLVFGLFACKGKTVDKSTDSEPSVALVTCEVKINGMTCTGCEQTIENAVIGLEGIKSVEASHTEGMALIVAEADKFDSVSIKSKIDGTGYSAVQVRMK